MKTPAHMLIGALVAAAPDAALAVFAWRRRWLPDHHPLVRAHRFLHGPGGLAAVAVAAYASHLIADHYSRHRAGPHGQTVRGVWHPRKDTR